MKTRRPAALAGAAVLGALALTGCNIDKPTPLVTVVSGSTSVHSQAECYTDHGSIDEAKADGCLNNRDRLTKISVPEGGSISVGVDKKLADQGWGLLIAGKPQTQTAIKTTYVRGLSLTYGAPGKDDAPLVLQVVQPDSKGGYRGIWSFSVEKKK